MIHKTELPLGNLSELDKYSLSSIKSILSYLEKRCELAEKYIEVCPCDNDITEEQNKAYWEWQNFIKAND